MSETDDLAARVAALEQHLTRLGEQVAGAASHTPVGALIALREEQIGLCAQVGELRVEARRGFATLDAAVARLAARLDLADRS